MYVVNAEELELDNLYECGEKLADWLVKTKNIPLFGRGKNREYYFMKTEMLIDALNHVPLYISVFEILSW